MLRSEIGHLLNFNKKKSCFSIYVRLYNKETLLNQSVMKDVPKTIKEPDRLERKVQRLQKQISLMYWIGWAGGYNTSNKK